MKRLFIFFKKIYFCVKTWLGAVIPNVAVRIHPEVEATTKRRWRERTYRHLV